MDVEREVMEALKLFFSPPIAKALYASTLRRTTLEGVHLEGERAAHFIRAIERALPAYIGDPTKARECASRMRAIAARAANVGVDASAPAATATDSGVSGSDVGSERPYDRSGEHMRLDESMVVRRGSTSSMKAAVPAQTNSTATIIRIEKDDDVVNAWEVGRDLCRGLGFGPLEQTKVATAISELARNILLYAGNGEVHLSRLEAPRRGLEIIAADRGPGIPDVAAVMDESYKSRKGMGVGLRGTRKLMDEFGIVGGPGKGTTVTVRKYVR